MLMSQPKGQAFALLEGGRLVHVRIPLALPEKDLAVPSKWTEMLQHMRRQAAELSSHEDAMEDLTMEGTGIGF